MSATPPPASTNLPWSSWKARFLATNAARANPERAKALLAEMDRSVGEKGREGSEGDQPAPLVREGFV